ncbi:uncharacterized protein LOC142784437 [Rhipicephalus microplus]|uniref:uncharacterized protein LOC142784437 n=1 Tax=Rhipicephalus microplus TaxID=6941 RepID=UPI003F6CB9D3
MPQARMRCHCVETSRLVVPAEEEKQIRGKPLLQCTRSLRLFLTFLVLLVHWLGLTSAGGAGGLLPEVEPVEAAQIAKYLPLIQQIEAIERIKAIKAIKSQSKDSIPPFLPIVIALHHKSEQQQSGKKKLRLFSLFS